MYMTTTFKFCIKYLDTERTMGCYSDPNGNRGTLIEVLIKSDGEYLISNKKYQPYIVLIPPEKQLLEYFVFNVTSSIVNGILIDGTFNVSSDKHFTEDSTCPQTADAHRKNSVKDCVIRRNEFGFDFRGIAINRPLFWLTNHTALETIRQSIKQYNDFNKTKVDPRVKAHMKSTMYGAKNAKVCEMLYKPYLIKCRTYDDTILWATLLPVKANKPSERLSRSVLMFITKTDFYSAFQTSNGI
ncbi:unnamed protein product, partial [Didymodactylos carnosus]